MTEEPISNGEPEESPASQPEGEPAEAPPIVFVSYTHETPEHKNWVKTLATDLVHSGVDALLDAWDVRLGEDLPLFMNKIRTSDRVLLICTPTYARKSNEGEGGVGYEGAVITGELAKSINTSKFVCVLRAGESEAAIPIFAEGRLYIDFRNDSEYEVCLEALLRDLLNAPADPKPPLGKNRFKAAPPENTEEPEDEEPHAALIHQAERLLSNKDMFGWKRLLHQERQAIHPRLAEWRNSIDPQIKDEAWQAKFEEGVQIAEPLMILALSAVNSQIDRIQSQTSLLDDLLNPPGWNRTGLRAIVEAPEALAFLYHYFLGAFLVYSRFHKEAVSLLTSKWRRPTREEYKPLWQYQGLTGWVGSLGGNAIESRGYLHGQYGARSWLRRFFHSEKSFRDSLRAYALLASLIELGDFMCHVNDPGKLNKDSLRWTASPFFVPPWDDADTPFEEIVQIAVPNRSVLEAIATAGGTHTSRINAAWPNWIQGVLHILGQSDRFRWMAVDMRHLVEHPPELPLK